jgi:hypothetical protein
MGYHGCMLSPALLEDMRAKGIDTELALSILEAINSGRAGKDPPIRAVGLPCPDGRSILDLRGGLSLRVDSGALAERLAGMGLEPSRVLGRNDMRGEIELDRAALTRLGREILPFAAFGILTGGGATTYVDIKKNRAIDPGLFERFKPDFERLAEAARGKPKGLAAAYIGADGRAGPSYLRLKQRALLLAAKAWQEGGRGRTRACGAPGGGFPLRPFQLASSTNRGALEEHLAEAREDPLCAGLIRDTGCDIGEFLTGVQPMVCAYTHSSEGWPKTVFSRAYGREDSALALPGGHGQCFRFLADILRALRSEGKRYAYLSNVDNLGALPDPLELGIMAATGARAGFDFSFRSPLDTKGGILVRSEAGGLACGDIGPAISTSELLRLEAEGGAALFNCATGLFDLDWLVPALDWIPERLPLRVHDQDKDAGRYSQAEQVAWEVIGLIEDPLIFAVRKEERFLAAKSLMETILMSRADDSPGPPAWEAARSLRRGLVRLLEGPFGMGAA